MEFITYRNKGIRNKSIFGKKNWPIAKQTVDYRFFSSLFKVFAVFTSVSIRLSGKEIV